MSLYTLTYLNDLGDKFEIFRNILKDDGYLLIRVHQYKFSKTYHLLNHFQKLAKAKHTFNHFSNNSLKIYSTFIILIYFYTKKNIEGITIIAKKVKKRI